MAEKFKTMIGGQALIEGILMQGPDKRAIVVRSPDGLVDKVEGFIPLKDRNRVLGWPLIRGCASLFTSLYYGVKALSYSAEFYPEDENGKKEPSKLDAWLEKKLSGEKAEKAVTVFGMASGAVLAVLLFFMLPTLVAGVLAKGVSSGIIKNLIEGLVRIVIFLAYLYGVSKMKDIKRVFRYHGAEHKTIFCYEAGEELTVENVRKQSRFHPRCGTSFLFVVMIISILVFSVVSWSSVAARLVFRLLLLPVVVGISYEINRFVGRHDNAFTRFLIAPGLWLQRITTAEPDDSMMEVGIQALKLVIPEQEGADRW